MYFKVEGKEWIIIVTCKKKKQLKKIDILIKCSIKIDNLMLGIFKKKKKKKDIYCCHFATLRIITYMGMNKSLVD